MVLGRKRKTFDEAETVTKGQTIKKLAESSTFEELKAALPAKLKHQEHNSTHNLLWALRKVSISFVDQGSPSPFTPEEALCRMIDTRL